LEPFQKKRGIFFIRITTKETDVAIENIFAAVVLERRNLWCLLKPEPEK